MITEDNKVFFKLGAAGSLSGCAYVKNHALFYPPEFRGKTATIGGNICTNAGGMRAVKYGVTRDCVQFLQFRKMASESKAPVVHFY